MGKRRSWIEAVKKIFGSDDPSTKEKKQKRKIWFFSKLRSRRAITMPAAASRKAKSMKDVQEEQSKRAMAVAVATAAAAEAAVAAAQAAAVVVRLTGTPPIYRRTRDMAAIKIQTAFRGYLARKALRALKAIVKLQALVRGRAVRRQTSLTLRSLQSLMKIQEQVRSHRLRISEDRRSDLNAHAPRRYSSIKGLERSWNSSSLSKEEIMAIVSHRQEAALRREKAMEYASTNQVNEEKLHILHPTNSRSEQELGFLQRRRSVCSTESSRSWLDQWVKNQNVDWDLGRSVGETTKLRRFLRDDESVTSSPALPSYMAATEAAKARSASTPKQRMGSPLRQGSGEVRMSPRLKARLRPPSQINPLD